MEKYRTLEIVQRNSSSPVFHLHLNRPSARNALSRDFFEEFPKALSSLDQNPNVGVIVLAGNGDHFCAGIDLNTLGSISGGAESSDRGRSGERLRRDIKFLQDAVTAIERCRKPVVAAVHGACIGGGVDIITACDIRYCTEQAFFSVKEVDLAITADLGSLQRLPSIVGYANAMELALTARRFSGSEAKALGLVSKVFTSKEAMDEGVRFIAQVSDISPRTLVYHVVSLKIVSLKGPLEYLLLRNCIQVSTCSRWNKSSVAEEPGPNFGAGFGLCCHLELWVAIVG